MYCCTSKDVRSSAVSPLSTDVNFAFDMPFTDAILLSFGVDHSALHPRQRMFFFALLDMFPGHICVRAASMPSSMGRMKLRRCRTTAFNRCNSGTNNVYQVSTCNHHRRCRCCDRHSFNPFSTALPYVGTKQSNYK